MTQVTQTPVNDAPRSIKDIPPESWRISQEDWNWINAHPEILEQHRGEYIAIWNKRVILHGTDTRLLAEQLKAHPDRHEPLLIFRVPTLDEANSLIIM
jgi:hypothetical protein